MSAFNRLGNVARERLETAFARAEPDAKWQAGAHASSQPVRESRSPGESPLPREKSAWLKRMLTDTMTAMGEHIDERLTDSEKAAQRADDAIAAADARACQAQAENAALAERVTLLEAAAQVRPTVEEAQRQAAEAATAAVAPVVERLERVEARPSGAAAAASSAAVARIGGIGWDSAAALLLERGKDVLARAGVESAVVTAMAPVTSRAGTGSSVQVAFAPTAALERARAQAVHRLAEDLSDASEGPPVAVEKNLATGTWTGGVNLSRREELRAAGCGRPVGEFWTSGQRACEPSCGCPMSWRRCRVGPLRSASACR